MRKLKQHISRYFPLLDTFQSYNSKALKGDLNAGLTIGIMLIPQGMAYALIAGLPPEYGLYAALAPLIMYALMGTSRHLGVGPVALVALLVASTVNPLAETPEEYIAMSILLALMVGGIQLLFGFLKLGFLVNLLSHPVLSGFISAAAIYIGLSQLHHLLGVESVSGGLHEILYGIAIQFELVSVWTLAIGIAAIAVMVMIKRKIPVVPGPVVAVAAGIILLYLTNLEEVGVAVVGEIPEGLPAFQIPMLDWDVMSALFPMAMAIALVGYMEAIAVAKAIQQKSKEYSIDANQELVAIGAGNIVGSFFQAFPGTGSFSRTAVSYQSGGKTVLTSLIAVAVIAVALLFLTPIFYYLPKAILGAIIMLAVYGLIDLEGFKKLWKLKHYDRYMFLATFAGTLFVGIKEGILLGVTLSVIMLLYRTARPNQTVLGRIPNTNIYRNVDQYETERQKEFLVYRFDAPLHFANAEYFRNRVSEILEQNPDTECLILDLNGVNDIDSTGLDELFELKKDLEEKGVKLHLAEVKHRVRSLINRKLSDDTDWKFYMTIEGAIKAAAKSGEDQEKIYTDTSLE